MHIDTSRNRANAAQTKAEHPGIGLSRSKSSHWLRDPASGRCEKDNMHQNCIQKARSRFGNACSEIERKDFRPLRLPPWPWLLLCLLGLITLRNIRGAYREKVTSTASIKHRSNSVDRGYRWLLPESALAFPEQAARFRPRSIESHEIDLLTVGSDLIQDG
jgi:hypothetical protein